jgi:hypothetical protein
MDRTLTRWVAVCAAAETVGMTAAAAAARAGDRLSGAPRTAGDTAVVVGLAVAGGIVEALAVGAATAVGLHATVPTLPRGRWIAVTTLVAGLCWGVGAAPAAVSAVDSAADAGSPSLWLVAAGALAIGLVTGGLLGAAQSLVLRGHVLHPWRWTASSCLAWPVPMAVIFVGASTPDPTWSTAQVLLLAVPTGALAGALLGAGLGVTAPALIGAPTSRRVVLRLLRLRAGRAALRGIVGLDVRGRRTGHRYAFPVMAAPEGDGLVVLVGRPTGKTWWRNLMGPTAVAVLRDGAWQEAMARAVTPDDHAHDGAVLAYRRRFPRISLGDDAVFVRIWPAPTSARVTGQPPGTRQVRT